MHTNSRTSAKAANSVLTFNGLRFARLGTKLLDGSEAGIHGYFSRTAKGVHLYKLDTALEAYLVANERQGFFPVSACTQEDGRKRYMFSTSSLTEAWLGLTGVGYLATHDLVRGMAFSDSQGGVSESASKTVPAELLAVA